MSEKQLILEIKKNPERFAEVYDTHYQTIFNYCFRRTQHFDAAQDITSETFLKAYLNIDTFRYKGIPIICWLYKIAGNEIQLFFRSKHYRPKRMNEIYYNQAIKTLSTNLEKEKEQAEAEMQKHEQFLQIQKAITQLPLKYQEVLALKYFEALKIKDIATILNKKVGTVKSLLSRGITKLKDTL